MNEDKKMAMNLLKTARGQIDGIVRMIEDDRYCVDISKQTLSAMALLKKANNRILEQHIRHCVKDAIEEGKGEEKIEEIVEILDVYLK